MVIYNESFSEVPVLESREILSGKLRVWQWPCDHVHSGARRANPDMAEFPRRAALGAPVKNPDIQFRYL